MSRPKSPPDVLIEQSLHHLGLLLEVFAPQLRPGQQATLTTDHYKITIEQRLVLGSAGGLVVKGS